jgi:hypothetical protein
MESYAPRYATDETAKKQEVSNEFGFNYGIRQDMNFYEMLPQIGFVAAKQLKEYTISTLKIKFTEKLNYQDIKDSFIKFDLVDHEMVVCVSRLFMPSPYMTMTWVFVTLVFVILALLGLCFIKFFVKDTMFENRKKECEEW